MKNEKPLVSVLIPTYNVGPYVKEAVQSVLNQTYQNLEIIIVDDCSTDTTYSILQKLAAEDNRIRLFRNETNSRIVETLNLAITKANGIFFARMDGDDVSMPQRIETQVRFLQENPEISLVGLNVSMIDENGTEIHKERYLENHEEIKEASNFVSPIPHFWIARRELYDAIGSYRIQSAEDLDFILRAIDAGYKMSNLPDVLYKQRIRAGNTASASGLLQRKSISYVRRLHAERKKTGNNQDSYNAKAYSVALQVTAFESYIFRYSSLFHFKYIALKNSNPFAAFFYRSLSILLYPRHQFSEVYNRFRYKLLLMRHPQDP